MLLAWLTLTNYYATAFKTGSYATPTTDKIILWVRPHPVDATASSDSLSKPTNYQMVRLSYSTDRPN